ncbi:MAG: efflux transporter periplasmic adaptor subunit [Helicobacteraceae bacterium CG2_30_36_10]|nr:MAG: efflux transporter periplasmic adaptor subunit [Helicobacteraceae bacterium CG2_30_36_10]
MKTWTKYLIALLILALGSVAFYFKVYIPKSTYETLSPKRTSLNVQVFGIGNVDAKDIYTISAQTGGRLTNILSDEGLWVKKGDLLATIDPVDLPNLLEEAKASLVKVRYESVATQKELQSLNAQKELLQISYERYEKLYKQKYVAKAEYDKANADLQIINAQIASSHARINSSQAEVLRVQKSIEALKVKLSRLSIYAPVDGYVIAKDAQISQTVSAGQSILKMLDTKTVWVEAYIDEQISSTVQAGQKVDITLRSQSDTILSGTLERISAISDAVTQERQVNISFDTLPTPFYINEQAQVAITTQNFSDILTIKAALLSLKNGKNGVWIVQNSTAHFVELSIVARSGEFVGVQSGVDESTKIIVPDASKKPLSEGMRVHL